MLVNTFTDNLINVNDCNKVGLLFPLSLSFSLSIHLSSIVTVIDKIRTIQMYMNVGIKL